MAVSPVSCKDKTQCLHGWPLSPRAAEWLPWGLCWYRGTAGAGMHNLHRDRAGAGVHSQSGVPQPLQGAMDGAGMCSQDGDCQQYEEHSQHGDPAGVGTHVGGLCRVLGHGDAAAQRTTCSITHPSDGLWSFPRPSPGSGSPAAASRRVQHCAGRWREGSPAKSLLCPRRCHAAGCAGSGAARHSPSR